MLHLLYSKNDIVMIKYFLMAVAALSFGLKAEAQKAPQATVAQGKLEGLTLKSGITTYGGDFNFYTAPKSVNNQKLTTINQCLAHHW